MPGLNLWGFLTPPVAGADLRACLEASYFLGAFCPVDFLAVCLVLAILYIQIPRDRVKYGATQLCDLIGR